MLGVVVVAEHFAGGGVNFVVKLPCIVGVKLHLIHLAAVFPVQLAHHEDNLV